MALDPATADAADAAVRLEFTAALLRNPDALRRFGENFKRRAGELHGPSDGETLAEPVPLEVWAIGQALVAGLLQYRFILPEVLTPDAFGHALALLDDWAAAS